MFTKFDIRWGYNNVRIKDGDQWKATFITNQGLFEPTVMFFGLTNSQATFQTMMNTIFMDEMAQGWLTIYMDDMAIHTGKKHRESDTQHRQRHWQLVSKVLSVLQYHNLFLKPEKCEFEKDHIDFLGIRIQDNRVFMEESKVEKVANWKLPTDVCSIQEFLGFTGYYRQFIKDYSKIARPLLDLTKTTTPWHWGKAQKDAFECLHQCMCSKPVLRQPDFQRQFYVSTDASAYGVGAVLSQVGESFTPSDDGKPPPKSKLHLVAFYSATVIGMATRML